MSRIKIAGLCLLTPFVLATPSHAACGRWSTSFGSLAGEGEDWHIYMCVEKTAQDLEFEITCGFNVRFMPALPEGTDLGDGKVVVDYAIDGKSFKVNTQMEELDGALAADVPVNSPLIKAMKSGHTAVMTLQGTKLPPYTAPLKGAKAAFTKLIQKCD